MRIDDLIRQLAELPIEAVQAATLADAGEMLAEAVREALSVQPGGAHEQPWIETGGLRESIGFDVDGEFLLVGSRDPVAADQERGTRTVPARPFFGPVGVAASKMVAEAIGSRFRALLATGH